MKFFMNYKPPCHSIPTFFTLPNFHNFITLLTFITFISPISAQKSMEINLNSNWEFRKVGDSGWMPATVPGCVHTDLMANNSIPDPFMADNELQVQWVEREDWEYQTTFRVSRRLLNHQFIELNFAGLDTYAEIYLNDKYFGTTENMFVQYSFNVKEYLIPGNNKLVLKFLSSTEHAEKLMSNSPVKYSDDIRVWARKAQYQFGWDWGPKLSTSGIWKPVTIKAWNKGRINSLFFHTVYATPDSAKFFIEYEYELDTTKNIKLQLTNITTGEIIKTNYISDKKYKGRIYQTIEHPKLWWCAGLGEPDLYTFELKISNGLKVIDRQTITAGIRTTEFINNDQANGGDFYFKLNNVPVFAKGTNIIPLHSFPSAVKKTDYRNLLTEARAMNMNMIRIWGGGIYEDDYFYQLCDSLGLMVWQDFMYACAMYPMHELNHQGSITDEVVQQIKRLRSHPSIVLWCGNNEIMEGWQNWGWQETFKYTEQQAYKVYSNYSDWFDINFHSELKLHTGIQNNYYPSSPSFGWGHIESLLEGDCHYWGVWWGHEPFEAYNQKIPRFMSEYGFQGMPSFNSFKKFISINEITGKTADVLLNPTIKIHQKHPIGYETIQEYMMRDYIVPENFDDFIYVSQLLQARGMQIAIEAHRRNMPYCMGTLFWQLNDCWPVTSWSVIDYYGNRKASYYTVKEKYKAVMLSVESKNDSIFIWVVNDSIQDLDCFINYNLHRTTSDAVDAFSERMVLPAQSAIIVKSFSVFDYLRAILPDNAVLFLSVTDAQNEFASTVFNFTAPKDILLRKPSISFEFDEINSTISVQSDVYVKGLYLYLENAELKLSENFFDLAPLSRKTIKVEGGFPLNMGELLRHKCLNTIYRN